MIHYYFINNLFSGIFNNYSYVLATGTLTLHSIAHDGVSSTVGGSDTSGNAITGITVNNSTNSISVTKGTFAEAYNGDKRYACFASKADSLKVSAAVVSGIKGIYIDENGKPKAMSEELHQSITSDMCLIKKLSDGLSFR